VYEQNVVRNDAVMVTDEIRAATRAVTATAVEKRAMEWSKFSLTGQHGQRHGRDGRRTGLGDVVGSIPSRIASLGNR
jgi:hypothetical protein